MQRCNAISNEKCTGREPEESIDICADDDTCLGNKVSPQWEEGFCRLGVKGALPGCADPVQSIPMRYR